MGWRSPTPRAADWLTLLSLIGGLTLGLAAPAQAQDQLDNTGIQFIEDTVVEFEFLESNGVYQSTFGVINLNTMERTPLLIEVKPSDRAQAVNRPSDFEADVGTSNADDFQGTPGNAVPTPLAEFQFEANTPYAFYLESFYNGMPAGLVYSTDIRNSGREQQVIFDGEVTNLGTGGVLVQWDDTGALLVNPPDQDRDFDDFIVRLGGHIACPLE